MKRALSVKGPRARSTGDSLSFESNMHEYHESIESVLSYDDAWPWDPSALLRRKSYILRQERRWRRSRPLPRIPSGQKRIHHRYSKPLPEVPEFDLSLLDVGHTSNIGRVNKGKERARDSAVSIDTFIGHKRTRSLPDIPPQPMHASGSSASTSGTRHSSPSTSSRALPIPPSDSMFPTIPPTAPTTTPSLKLDSQWAVPYNNAARCMSSASLLSPVIDWDVVMDEIMHRFSTVSSIDINGHGDEQYTMDVATTSLVDMSYSYRKVGRAM